MTKTDRDVATIREAGVEIDRLREENARLREALCRLSIILTVPAAEFVPAIVDALDEIQVALAPPQAADPED